MDFDTLLSILAFLAFVFLSEKTGKKKKPRPAGTELPPEIDFEIPPIGGAALESKPVESLPASVPAEFTETPKPRHDNAAPLPTPTSKLPLTGENLQGALVWGVILGRPKGRWGRLTGKC